MPAVQVEFAKHFTNVDEVFNKMLELGYFVNRSQRDQAVTDLPVGYEHWYGNGIVELRITPSTKDGVFVLKNHLGVINPYITHVFNTAKMI